MEEVYIISAKRTPMGGYGGKLASKSAIDLGAIAIKDAVNASNCPQEAIEAVVMGNVVSANLGQAPARQASIKAGLPKNVCATTVNKVCASGMKALFMIYQEIKLQNISVGVAGGMESMSQSPFYIQEGRFGLNYGHKTLVDGLVKDGLSDAYGGESMGVFADKISEKYQVSRE
jgi:acetyl-CoA C-acetyltransferase